MLRYFLIVLLIHGLSLHAQQARLDSLTKALTLHTPEDSAKTSLLIETATCYRTIDPSKGLQISDRAIALARKLNIPEMLAAAYSVKGSNYYYLGKDTLALAQYNQSMQLCRRYDLKEATIMNMNGMGILYDIRGDYIQSLDCYLKALKIADDHHIRTPSAIRLHTNIGITYRNLKEYNKALEHYQLAIALYREINDTVSIGFDLGNIASTYAAMNKKAEAKEHFLKALAFNQSTGNKKLIASNLYNLGAVTKEMGHLDTALVYFSEALVRYEKLGNKRFIGMCYSEIGAIYAYAPTALLSQYNIPVRQRYRLTIEYMKKGLEMAEASGNLEGLSNTWYNLADYYEHNKQPVLALDAYHQFLKLNDSLLTEDKKTAVMRKEMEYIYDRQKAVLQKENEKKQALASAEIKRQRTVRNSVIGGTVLVLLMSGLSFAFYKRKRDAEQLRLAAEQKAQIADTEMKALRAQMNPHFIFNALNSINDYIARNEIQIASGFLARFAQLMRVILENSEEKEIPLAEDLVALESYLQLEALRLNNSFTYNINVAGDIDSNNTLIPPMLLQPFVENCIWHGFSGEKSDGLLDISVTLENNMLLCTITDNGIGRKAAESNTGKRSMGMRITQSRIDNLRHSADAPAAIIFTDLSCGTKVEIRIPLHLLF